MIPPRVPNTEAYWRPACSEIFTSTNIKLIFRAFSGLKQMQIVIIEIIADAIKSKKIGHQIIKVTRSQISTEFLLTIFYLLI